MSVYSVKGKGWRYDFTLKGTRYTEAWFPTKMKAKQAESKRREELNQEHDATAMPTDMAFLDLINLRLDHVKAYNSDRHYTEYVYLAKHWIALWGKIPCRNLTEQEIKKFILKRRKVSACTANKEIRYLRATFNFGVKKGFIRHDPTKQLEFFPDAKKVKYVPSAADIDKVIEQADPDTQDYLWTIRETMARMNEINQLTWEDINFEMRYVILYTRKKKGGNLLPRKIPMTQKLYEVLFSRYNKRDKSKPWVFWHRYYSRKAGEWVEGPFRDRKRIMKTLCKKAGVRYFRFHALRHSGASIMENNNVSLGAIQRVLGHENRATTEIYLHSIGNTERDALAAYENARTNSHTDSHTKK